MSAHASNLRIPIQPPQPPARRMIAGPSMCLPLSPCCLIFLRRIDGSPKNRTSAETYSLPHFAIFDRWTYLFRFVCRGDVVVFESRSIAEPLSSSIDHLISLHSCLHESVEHVQGSVAGTRLVPSRNRRLFNYWWDRSFTKGFLCMLMLRWQYALGTATTRIAFPVTSIGLGNHTPLVDSNSAPSSITALITKKQASRYRAARRCLNLKRQISPLRRPPTDTSRTPK